MCSCLAFATLPLLRKLAYMDDIFSAAPQTLKSTQAMADAMRGATKAMGAMNKQMNLPALTKIMRDFERQNEKMEMTSEMMGDAVDDAFEVPHLNPEHLSVTRLVWYRLALGHCPLRGAAIGAAIALRLAKAAQLARMPIAASTPS